MLLVEDEFAGATGFDVWLPFFYQYRLLLLIDKKRLDKPTFRLCGTSEQHLHFFLDSDIQAITSAIAQ